MKKIVIILSLVVGTKSFAQEIEVKNLKKHVYFLADDKMKGRGTGSEENLKAAKYIAKEFKKYKLQPLGEDGYFQGFEAKVKKVKVVDSIRSAKNVIAFLDNKADKTIVIGAHYDHLGEGKQGSSLAKDSYGMIHNGADDNASGVAGLLELARFYSKNKVTEPVNFLFIAFGAEELGLVGSRYFVKHPTYGTTPAFETIFNEINPTDFVKFYTGYEGRGGSDQTSFYEKDIPVLFFHTGGHDDYHKPTDDADKVDYESLKGILNLEKAVIEGSFKIETMPFRSTDKTEK